MTETSSPAPAEIGEVLHLLQRSGHPVAPHVAARLHAALSADPAAIAQVAAAITPAQRAGASALPDPLPLVRAVSDAVGPALRELDDIEIRLLLSAAVSVDGRVDVALAAVGTTMAAALASGAAAHLTFAAGRLAFADPRVRVHVHGASTLAARATVHAAMADAYRAAGDDALATWHTSLSTLEGDARLVPTLLRLAERALRAGATEWAHAVAREAASHAPADERLCAQVAAGRAALASGLVDDASAWLQAPVAASGDVAAISLAAYVQAVTLREGNVPDADIARVVTPLLDGGASSPEAVDAAVDAVAVAARLHAERCHRADAEAMLAIGERLAHTHARSVAPLRAARRWCAVFGVDRSAGGSDEGASSGSELARIAAALEQAHEERGDIALGMLQSGVGATLGDASPLHGEMAHPRTSPLDEAHRRVVVALVLFWEGQLARARSELADAAAAAPVALVFAGLGVTLARRLDACTDGELRATTLALEATCPTPQARTLQEGFLVDRAIAAYLDGRMTEAATLLALASDGAAGPTDDGLPLPGLDEPSVWLLAGRPDEARRSADRLEPTHRRTTRSQRRSALARTRIATSGADEAAAACRAAAEASRTVTSGYDRGRTEMLIGRRYAMIGELAMARTHLLAASGLFDAAGAVVWRRACEADLALLPSEPVVSVLTAPIALPASGARPGTSSPSTPVPPAPHRPSGARGAPDDGDLLSAACREAWAGVLTERELEVALLVTQGLSNREVAAELYVSVRTVEVHLGRIFTKVGVGSRLTLTVHAHRLAREYASLAG